MNRIILFEILQKCLRYLFYFILFFANTFQWQPKNYRVKIKKIFPRMSNVSASGKKRVVKRIATRKAESCIASAGELVYKTPCCLSARGVEAPLVSRAHKWDKRGTCTIPRTFSRLWRDKKGSSRWTGWRIAFSFFFLTSPRVVQTCNCYSVMCARYATPASRGTVIAPYGRQFKWRSRRQEIYNTTRTPAPSPTQPTSIVKDT